MSFDTIKGVPINNIITYIINGESFREELNKYKGTSLKSANKFLQSNLQEEEKEALYLMLNSTEGWYRKTHGMETIKLKGISMLTGLSREIISNNEEDFNLLLSLLNVMDNNQEKILKSAYIKQKLVTLKNLHNNKNILGRNKSETIVLYRGIKRIGNKQCEYEAFNMESWTAKKKVARWFAGNNGYIIKKEFKFEDIFAYKKSIFKYSKYKDEKVSKLINIEHEYIVEFTEENCIIPLSNGDNLISYIDSYLEDNW